MKKMPRRILLDELDTEGISQLLRSGFSLSETMSLLVSPRNTEVFQEIRSHLENGERIEDFFLPFCARKYRRYLAGFILYLPFASALSLAIAVADEENSARRQILKQTIYPLLLLAGTIVGIFLFQTLCLPSLKGMLKAFGEDPAAFEYLDILTAVLRVFLIVIGITAVTALLYLRRPSHRLAFFRKAEKIMPGNILTQYWSISFIRYFKQCVHMGISTKAAIELLKHVPEREIICFLASSLETQLIAGNSFDNAIQYASFDFLLIRFMKIAVYARNLEELMDGYLETAAHRTERQCRYFSRIIQIGAYCFIGLILIMVYRMLMLPMAMLTKI